MTVMMRIRKNTSKATKVHLTPSILFRWGCKKVQICKAFHGRPITTACCRVVEGEYCALAFHCDIFIILCVCLLLSSSVQMNYCGAALLHVCPSVIHPYRLLTWEWKDVESSYLVQMFHMACIIGSINFRSEAHRRSLGCANILRLMAQD